MRRQPHTIDRRILYSTRLTPHWFFVGAKLDAAPGTFQFKRQRYVHTDAWRGGVTSVVSVGCHFNALSHSAPATIKNTREQYRPGIRDPVLEPGYAAQQPCHAMGIEIDHDAYAGRFSR